MLSRETMQKCQSCRGTGLAGKGLCDFSPQTGSSRSNTFDSCLSEPLEVNRWLPEQHLPATGRHVAPSDDGWRVRDYLKDGAQHQASAWTYWSVHPKPPRRLKQRGRQRERDSWQPRQGKQGTVFKHTQRVFFFSNGLKAKHQVGSRAQKRQTVALPRMAVIPEHLIH